MRVVDNPISRLLDRIGGIEGIPSFALAILEGAIFLLMLGCIIGGSVIGAVVFFFYGNLVLVLFTKLIVDQKIVNMEERVDKIEEKITWFGSSDR